MKAHPSLRAIRGLYPIFDLEAVAARGLDPELVLGALLEARPSVLQLRAKAVGSQVVLAQLRAMVEPCARAGTLLVANDRPDLAAMAGAGAIHVGQQDVPVPEVRRVAPGLLVGLSTHDLGQIEEALQLAPDYLAIGPVFPTGSKAGAESAVGVELLAAAHELTSAHGVPLVAIGGINGSNLAQVAPHAESIAVIAELFAAGTSAAAITGHCRELMERLQQLQGAAP